MQLFSSAWKSLTNPGGWIFGCDPIPLFANRPYVKEADEPGLSGKPLHAKIGQVLRPMSNFVNATFFRPPENHWPIQGGEFSDVIPTLDLPTAHM